MTTTKEKVFIEADSTFEINFSVDLEKELIKKDLTSDYFKEKNAFLDNLFSPESQADANVKIEEQTKVSPFYEGVLLENWKNTENVSSRLIEYNDDSVILECLIDREQEIYEEREFVITLFEGYNVEVGSLFYLRFFERRNELKLEIHDDPGLTRADDFTSKNLTELFKQSRLFKK